MQGYLPRARVFGTVREDRQLNHREACLTCSGAVVYVRGRPMSRADADEKMYILRLKKFSKYEAFQNVKCRLAGFFSKVGTQGGRSPKGGLQGDFRTAD